eukprot:2694833-Rhodomonas_salina.1
MLLHPILIQRKSTLPSPPGAEHQVGVHLRSFPALINQRDQHRHRKPRQAGLAFHLKCSDRERFTATAESEQTEEERRG